MNASRIGHGYDVHAFTTGDGFVLGGVRIADQRSMLAHSDGDVLIHALCDALLGAIGAGDIGQLYPDSDPHNANRDSREFLREVRQRVVSAGYRLGNADVTIIAQAPKMAPHIARMTAHIADDLGVAIEHVNVKATTTEKLGFTGRGEGIAAEAVCLIARD